MPKTMKDEPRVLVVKSRAVERARRAAEKGKLMPPATMTVHPTRKRASDARVTLSRAAAAAPEPARKPAQKSAAPKSTAAKKPRRR